MKRKTYKNKITQYTAFIPKTLKATKSVGKSVMNKIEYIFNNTTKKIRKSTKLINMRTAKSIRALTKKRRRN